MEDHFYKVKDVTALAMVALKLKHSLKQKYKQDEMILNGYTIFRQLNHMLLLLNKIWVCLPMRIKANLLTLNCGEGKCSVYCKTPSKESW